MFDVTRCEMLAWFYVIIVHVFGAVVETWPLNFLRAVCTILCILHWLYMGEHLTQVLKLRCNVFLFFWGGSERDLVLRGSLLEISGPGFPHVCPSGFSLTRVLAGTRLALDC